MLMRREIPYPHIPIVAPRNDLVLGKTKAGHRTSMPDQGGRAPAFFTVPDLRVVSEFQISRKEG